MADSVTSASLSSSLALVFCEALGVSPRYVSGFNLEILPDKAANLSLDFVIMPEVLRDIAQRISDSEKLNPGSSSSAEKGEELRAIAADLTASMRLAA